MFIVVVLERLTSKKPKPNYHWSPVSPLHLPRSVSDLTDALVSGWE